MAKPSKSNLFMQESASLFVGKFSRCFHTNGVPAAPCVEQTMSKQEPFRTTLWCRRSLRPSVYNADLKSLPHNTSFSGVPLWLG